MPLTDVTIRNAKPRDKHYKLSDSKGLHILIHNAGGKYFRLNYRFGGKQKTLALGVYPDTKLAAARKKRDAARVQVAAGIDPGLARKVQKTLGHEESVNRFEAIAREWHIKQAPKWSEGYKKDIIKRLERYIFPWLGSRAIISITPQELLTVLRKLENRGTVETAHKVKRHCSEVFRYAIATGRGERDPSADLKGALAPVRLKHMAAITEPVKIGGLLRAIDGFDGTFVVKCALRLAPLIFVRPGELRHAEWTEFDLDNAEWRIPASKMKMKSTHIVPLARQSIAIIQAIEPVTGHGRYVYPCARTSQRPMSENAVLSALRRMGYAKEEMTGYGFRAMASTRLHEQGWQSDIIDRQLAHSESNSIKAAYNHAMHLPERRKMMQVWADYLDELRGG